MVQIVEQTNRKGKNRPPSNKNNIGSALEMLRIEKNWTQRVAAANAKISRTSWHFIEKKGAMPHYEDLVGIAEAFNIKRITLLILAFDKIKLWEQEGSAGLAYNGHETSVVFGDDLSEKSYGAIKLMMGRKITRIRKKKARSY